MYGHAGGGDTAHLYGRSCQHGEMSGPAPRLNPLLSACHPLPTAAVTAMMVALFSAAGNDVRTVVIGSLAVLTGQLSIGWSNDAWDAGRDRSTGRSDKPVARGELSEAWVFRWAVFALISCVPLSLLLGWRAGLVHLAGVGCGWWYNAGLKGSVWSPAPFAIAFGGLPAVATLALPGHPWPPWWSMLAGALIGVAAHLANVAPDVDDDLRSGIRGLPQRIGAARSADAAMASALAACAIVTFATPPDRARVLAFAAAFATTVIGSSAYRRTGGEAAFVATVVIAAISVALLATSAHFPTG